MSKNIAVFFGGVSGENEISIITGTMACNLLKRSGCAVLPVYITQGGDFLCGDNLADIKNLSGGKIPPSQNVCFAKGGIYVLSKRGKPKKFLPVYCAPNCCHGGWGEGGGISGLCLAMSIPLASAGVFESSALIDKYLTKILMKGLGVPTVEYLYLRDMGGATHVKDFPVMVKPARLGSSIGVVKADNSAQLTDALQAAFALDTAVLVERYISDRREINCAAYFADGKIVTSPCEEVFGGDILSYDDKYSGSGKRVFPAHIPQQQQEYIRSVTAKVYSALCMRGIVRFDFIIEGEKVYLSEINTVPGSLSHYLLSGNFKEFENILSSLISQAVEDDKNIGSKMLVNTGIINNFVSNACKIK